MASRTRVRLINTWTASAPYRTLMSLMLFSSTASFAALGVLSLFARDDLGATDTGATVNFVVVALAGMVVMVATGHLSDHGTMRRVIIPASLAWLATGYLLLSVVRSYPAMLVVGIVFFCAVGVPGAQLMAYARDLVQGRNDTGTVVIAAMRIVLSLGSFAGFGIGGVGLAYLGARPVFRIVAVACTGCVALSWYLLRTGDPVSAATPERPTTVDGVDRIDAARDTTPDPRGVRNDGQRLLLVLAVVMVLFSCGRVMLLSQLPILMRVSLHAPLAWTGFALALPPLCELVFMPLVAVAAVRWGRGRVFLAGGAASVAYYGGLATVTTPRSLLLLQVVYAVFGAATVMVGIDLAQRLMVGRTGRATSIYLSHENVATVSGSLVATASVATLGNQIGFLVPGILCLAALGLAGWLFATRPDAFDLRRTRGGTVASEHSGTVASEHSGTAAASSTNR